jgi:hypothetical protein
MIRHISKPEYVHVLLNPLPVYGLAVGVLGLFIALLFKTRAARVTTLALVLLSAASAWPVYHMRRAEPLIYVFHVVSALSALGITAEFVVPKAAVPMSDTAINATKPSSAGQTLTSWTHTALRKVTTLLLFRCATRN